MRAKGVQYSASAVLMKIVQDNNAFSTKTLYKFAEVTYQRFFVTAYLMLSVQYKVKEFSVNYLDSFYWQRNVKASYRKRN